MKQETQPQANMACILFHQDKEGLGWFAFRCAVDVTTFY